MTTNSPNLGQIQEALKSAAAFIGEDEKRLDDSDFRTWAVGALLAASGGNPALALEATVVEFLKAVGQTKQLAGVIQEMDEQMREQPKLARVLSGPFGFGSNGSTRQMMFAAPLGREATGASCISIREDQTPPEPLDVIFIDGGSQFYLGLAPVVPFRTHERHTVISAAVSDDLPALGEVVIDRGQETEAQLFCRMELADEIETLMESGETVKVRHDGWVVDAIVASNMETKEDWLDYPPLEGPGVDEMKFRGWLAEAWRRDVRGMKSGGSSRTVLVGPTGSGKTEAVLRSGRQAARESGKRFALIRISPSTVGSSYFTETERAIGRAFRRAKWHAERDDIVIILLDEADALAGNSEGRHEGSADRRVRNTLQEELSHDLPGVFIYATCNERLDSWLPTAISRRFKTRKYDPPNRSQMAAIIATYADRAALDAISITAKEFGLRAADYLFSDSFVVAKVHMHSGATEMVPAHMLHNCSPGKLRDLTEGFCRDLKDNPRPPGDPLLAFWSVLDREFLSHSLNKNNVYDLTFLVKPVSDSVRHVESVRPQRRSIPIRAAAVE